MRNPSLSVSYDSRPFISGAGIHDNIFKTKVFFEFVWHLLHNTPFLIKKKTILAGTMSSVSECIAFLFSLLCIFVLFLVVWITINSIATYGPLVPWAVNVYIWLNWCLRGLVTGVFDCRHWKKYRLLVYHLFIMIRLNREKKIILCIRHQYSQGGRNEKKHKTTNWKKYQDLVIINDSETSLSQTASIS